MQCGANGIWDESGCFVYEVVGQDRVVVRSSPSNSSFHWVQNLYFEHGEKISIDLIRHSRIDLGSNERRQRYRSDGPFLRLSDGSGWVIANDSGEEILKRVAVEEEPEEEENQRDLWTFFAESNPQGIGLLRHPSENLSSKANFFEPDEGGRKFFPMQRIVCDRKVPSSTRDGSNFYRVQGTCGWIKDRSQGISHGDAPGSKTYRQLVVPGHLVETGLFAFRVIAPDGLHIRKDCHVGDTDCNLTQAKVNCGEIVIANLIRKSPLVHTGNGPFFRLADGSGWLFQHRLGGTPLMEEVRIETDGFYRLEVLKDARPRAQPLHDYYYFPEDGQPTFLQGDTILCDKKVTNPATNVAWYREKNTELWIQDKMSKNGETEYESILSEILPREPTGSKGQNRRNEPWGLSFVRGNANAIGGLEEIEWDADQQVLTYRRQHDGALLHVHLISRRIGKVSNKATSLPRVDNHHSVEYHTNCSDADLKMLLDRPQIRSNKRARSSPPSLIRTQWLVDEDEEDSNVQQRRLISPDVSWSNSDLEVNEDESHENNSNNHFFAEFDAELESRRNLIDCQRQIRNLLYRQGNLLRSLQLHEEERSRECREWEVKTSTLERYQRRRENGRMQQEVVPPGQEHGYRRNVVRENMLVGSIVGGFVGLAVSPVFGPWIVQQLGLYQWLS